MQKPNKLIHTLGILALLGVGGTAHSAVTLSADESARIEEIAGICMLASKGVYEIAIDHQNGVSKDKAKKNLDKALKRVEKGFSKKDMVSFIDETWQNGLNIIYKMPVYDDKADKERFVQQAVEGSLNACFNDLDGWFEIIKR